MNIGTGQPIVVSVTLRDPDSRGTFRTSQRRGQSASSVVISTIDDSGSFQCQPALMPTIRAATENRDIPEAGSQQLCCRTRRTPIRFADYHNRLLAHEVGGSVGQLA